MQVGEPDCPAEIFIPHLAYLQAGLSCLACKRSIVLALTKKSPLGGVWTARGTVPVSVGSCHCYYCCSSLLAPLLQLCGNPLLR